MNAYGGSAGIGSGADLRIDDRLVTIDYSDKAFAGSQKGQARVDWYCDQCGASNFARRTACFRCQTPKGPNAKPVLDEQRPLGMEGDLLHSISTVPTPILMIKGFPMETDDVAITNALRDYAQVKQVRIVRCRFGLSRGFCFVEFFSVEHATHTLTTWHSLLHQAPLLIDGAKISMVYAPKAALTQANMAANQTGHKGAGKGLGGKGKGGNRYASAALEQAQWAMKGNRGERSRDEGEKKDEKHWTAALASKKPPPEWPPTFEEGGAAWVYDSNSGYYAEAASGFWYSTTTKLYYNAHKKIYYVHTPTTNPPFTVYAAAPAPAPVTAATIGSAIAQQLTAPSPAGAATANPPNSNQGQQQQATAASNPAQAAGEERKKAQKEIAEWEKKQRQLKAKQDRLQKQQQQQQQQQADTSLQMQSGGSTSLPSLAHPLAPLPVVPPTTVSGDALLLQKGLNYATCKELLLEGKPAIYLNKEKWACLVSRRQFPSEGKIKLHVEKSQLYREALEKCIKEGKLSLKPDVAEVVQEPVYRDRASERRQRDPAPKEGGKKGTSAIKRVEAHYAKVVDSYAPTTASRPSGVDAAIDSSNIGNTMLKQMGWKDGSGLGRRGEGIKEPVRVQASKHGAGIGTKSYDVNYNDSYLKNAKKIAEQRYNEEQVDWN